MTTTTMTRAEAIETFVRDHMTGDDLATVIDYMNSYDGSFADCEYILMDEFDEILKDESPMTVARAIHKGIFDPNDDYFKVVYDGEDMALFFCRLGRNRGRRGKPYRRYHRPFGQSL